MDTIHLRDYLNYFLSVVLRTRGLKIQAPEEIVKIQELHEIMPPMRICSLNLTAASRFSKQTNISSMTGEIRKVLAFLVMVSACVRIYR